MGALVATMMAADWPVRRPARPACCHIEAMVPGYPARTAMSRWPMSMPSSSALVGDDTEHLTRAQPLLDLAPPKGQVSAAVAAHHPGIARPVLHRLLHARQHHLRGQPALAEHDGGNLLLEEARGELGRLAEVRGADAQLRVHDGRVVAEEDLLPRGRSALASSSVTASPLSRSASSFGFAMVAEAMMNCGVEP